MILAGRPHGPFYLLLEGVRLARLLDPFIQPLLELLGRLDGDKSPHPVMAQTAELRAGDLGPGISNPLAIRRPTSEEARSNGPR